MEEITRFRGDVGDISRPDGHRQQHDIHGGKAGYRKAPRQLSCGRRFFLFGAQRHEWMAVITAVLEDTQNLRRTGDAVRPRHLKAAICEIQPRFRHSGQAFHRILDPPYAAAAGNAFDRQLHAQRAVPGWLGIMRKVESFTHLRYLRVMRLRERNTRELSR